MPVTAADNVLPRIGVLAPGPARAAIREVFLRHVIGGKRLSRGPRFAALVRAATPDAVLTGVEVLADTLGGDLAVVDVGGATTDVYSVLTPDERADGPGREVGGHPVAGPHRRGRSGDAVERPRGGRRGRGRGAAAGRRRGDDAGCRWRGRGRPIRRSLAADAAGRAADRRIATLAATVALRRHARGRPPANAHGRDLRDVRLLVGFRRGAAPRRPATRPGGAGARC